jgi:phi13 family phage major tail protein
MGKAYPGVGLTNFHYAPITYDAATNELTYGTPVRISNGVSINESPSNNQEKLYGDNTPAFVASSKGPREITIEQPAITAADKAALLGMTLDATSKELTEKQTDVAPAVAFGWEENLSDGGSRFHWLLWVEFVEDAKDYATSTDSPQFQTAKLKGTGLPEPVGGKIKVSVDTHDTTMTAANWFTAAKLNSFLPA